MSSLLGQAFVLLGLGFAAVGAIVGLGTGLGRRGAGSAWTVRCLYGFSASMLAANLVMIFALVTHDFSVQYVAQVGSRATPLLYTVVSLWSALEGSILFWGLILGGYLFAFARAHRDEPQRQMSLAVGSMLAVAVFFAFLIAGPANPFHAVSPVPTDGPGPNPLLQNHLLMIAHPPFLYLGYVGMTVPFGIAVGALLGGQLSDSWAGPLRRWTLIPWTFLTVGIILGAWWAYAVLGWGGYWAWDPVENASFLPWLTATAFMHSTMVQERRRMLKLWTMSLSLATFVLTILGTFMTRSGIFNSVHSFTQSDIGPTFLVFLGVLLVFCLVLLATRGHLLVAEGQIDAPVSRETTLLINNVVFVGLTFTVLLGTVFPLVSEAVRGVRLSVGEPYFNKMAVPGGLAILFLMGVGPMLPWGASDPALVRRQLLVPSATAAVVLLVCLALGLRGFYPLTAFTLAGFVTAVTLREMFLPAWVRVRERKEGVLTAVFQSATRARRRFGGYVVHLGIVVVIVAIAGSSAYVSHTTGTLSFGESMQLGGYSVKLLGLESGREPHRDFVAAKVEITDRGGDAHLAAPRLNYYLRSNDPIGTPAVHVTPREDLYLSLLAFNNQNRTASFNAWVFPLVSWIWWSLPLLVGGALIAAWPSRRRAAAAAPAASSPAPPAEPERGAA